jgi:predicted nucleic acid-binding protein
MSEAKRFVDTNVLLYLLSADASKADRAEQVLTEGAVLSIQVLNEFASVATRKLKMSIAEAREALATVPVAEVAPTWVLFFIDLPHRSQLQLGRVLAIHRRRFL